MNAFLTADLIGWAAGCAALPVALKLAARDNWMRSETAEIRSMWNTPNGRAAIILVGFIIWPIYILLLGLEAAVRVQRIIGKKGQS